MTGLMADDKSCAEMQGAAPDDQLEEDDEGADERHHGPRAADDLFHAPGLVFILIDAAVAGFYFWYQEAEKKNCKGIVKGVITNARARPRCGDQKGRLTDDGGDYGGESDDAKAVERIVTDPNLKNAGQRSIKK
jgi:hypothetical protein